MKRKNNANPLAAIHVSVREIIDTVMGTVLLITFISFVGATLNIMMAEKGVAAFSPAILAVCAASFGLWTVLFAVRLVHGMVFMPYRAEQLDGTRWRTPAGAVGKFRSSAYGGALVLAFPSGEVTDYPRESLVREP